VRLDATILLMAGTLLAGNSAAAAQDLRREVARVDDGVVTFQYRVQDDVEICENGVRVGNSRHYGRWSSGRDYDCISGFGEVRLQIRDGKVRDLQLQPPHSGASEFNLGEQAPREAADYLLWLAETATGEVAENAILPATLADGVSTWSRILDIARNRRRPDDVREQALFWVGQAAAEAVTVGLGEIAVDDTEDDDVRDGAVFALSQRPAQESVPILVELAETAESPDVRRSALFWLAQSMDDEALDFFERILRGG